MAASLVDLRAYCEACSDQYVAALIEACRWPSISADSAHSASVLECADWFRRKALESGFSTARLVPTSGYPVVYAEYIVDPCLPTALLYGHYDVQPIGDVSAWSVPPFEGVVKDGAVYARGATDDKGHVLMQMQALAAWLSLGAPPINVKLIAEGEEEIGSVHFTEFLRDHADMLSADVIIVSDTPGFVDERPALCIGTRGLLLADVVIQGPNTPVHSGFYGGGIRNPAEVLAGLLATLKDPHTGRILVDGFYDDVVPPSDVERRHLQSVPFQEEEWLAELGLTRAFGETGWTTLERIWRRPSLEINALSSGYAAASVNTVIPSHALAHLSCRLVPCQSPTKIGEALKAHLAERCPADATLSVETVAASSAVTLPIDSPLVGAASRAYEAALGEAPVIVWMGGSIPPLQAFAETGLPCLLVGISKLGDKFHGTDEHLSVDRLVNGTILMALALDEVARVVDRVPAAP